MDEWRFNFCQSNVNLSISCLYHHDDLFFLERVGYLQIIIIVLFYPKYNNLIRKKKCLWYHGSNHHFFFCLLYREANNAVGYHHHWYPMCVSIIALFEEASVLKTWFVTMRYHTAFYSICISFYIHAYSYAITIN